jgi:multiple sugar transport system permease protein
MTSETAMSAPDKGEIERASWAASVARVGGKILIYAALLIWTFVALFPLYWTLSTSFKLGKDVTQGHLIPWVDFTPSWKGFQALGLSPDTIFAMSNVLLRWRW